MKRQIATLLLALALTATLGAGASAAEDTRDAAAEERPTLPTAEEATARDASRSVSFAQLGAAMREKYYPLLAVEANLAALRAADGDADAIRQLEDAENRMLMGGETLYITLAGLKTQDAALSRTIAALERTAEEMKLRHELGQISELQLLQVENARAQALGGQQTLRMNMDGVEMQLKAMVGVTLDGTLTLSPLPTVTQAQLDAMDVQADLARAREKSAALAEAERTRDAALTAAEAGIAYGVPGAKESADAARYTYENEALSFELAFRTLYAQVKDAARSLAAAREALTLEDKSLAAAELKFEQGGISANALADARDKRAEASDAVASAQRELLSKYRGYYWAVEHGILNG